MDSQPPITDCEAIKAEKRSNTLFKYSSIYLDSLPIMREEHGEIVSKKTNSNSVIILQRFELSNLVAICVNAAVRTVAAGFPPLTQLLVIIDLLVCNTNLNSTDYSLPVSLPASECDFIVEHQLRTFYRADRSHCLESSKGLPP